MSLNEVLKGATKAVKAWPSWAQKPEHRYRPPTGNAPSVSIVKVYKYGGKVRALLSDGKRVTIGIMNFLKGQTHNMRVYPEEILNKQVKLFERRMRKARKA